MSIHDRLGAARWVADVTVGASEDEVAERLLGALTGMFAPAEADLVLLDHRGATRRLLGSSAEKVVPVAHLERTLGEGPLSGPGPGPGVVWAHDVATDPRWTRWGPAAAASGLRGLMAVRLVADDDHALGAAYVHTADPREFGSDERELLGLLAGVASQAITRLRNQLGLQAALETRTMIGQATGIMMERFGLDPDRAMGMLRRHSHQHHMKLRDVARLTVTGHRQPH